MKAFLQPGIAFLGELAVAANLVGINRLLHIGQFCPHKGGNVEIDHIFRSLSFSLCIIDKVINIMKYILACPTTRFRHTHKHIVSTGILYFKCATLS